MLNNAMLPYKYWREAVIQQLTFETVVYTNIIMSTSHQLRPGVAKNLISLIFGYLVVRHMHLFRPIAVNLSVRVNDVFSLDMRQIARHISYGAKNDIRSSFHEM